MRRRTCLQATAAGLSAILAGCQTLPVDSGEDTTPAPTGTASPTSTGTASPTETEPSPPDDVARPDYLDLLPRRHLKGTDETPNANFLRLDWQWYLEHYDTPMRFGATSDENWTLEANSGNLYEKSPPQYRLLHTPVGTTIQQGKILANILPEFPNLGPEIVQQCGFEVKNENKNNGPHARYVGPESATVEEVISYSKPGITIFVDVNISSLRTALEENPQEVNKNVPETVFYTGVGNARSREFFISEAWERPILCVETGNENPGSLGPAAGLVADVGTTESVFTLESVQWCLSQLVSSVPVIVGQINGGRVEFSGTNYNYSPIRSLKENSYDSVILGWDTSNGTKSSAQVVISRVDGDVIDKKEVKDIYEPDDGSVEFSYNSSVVSLSANW